MTSEGLGKRFDGDFADIFAKHNFALINRGTSKTVKCAQIGSEGPHRLDQKFLYISSFHVIPP